MKATLRGPTLVERVETVEGVSRVKEGQFGEDDSHGVSVDGEFWDGWSLVEAVEEENDD